MLTPAVRFVTKGQKAGGSIHLLCHVKPGVNANREGITAVSDEAIELCVAARAREGEANKAVREVIAETLKIPKSDVEIAKGMKSREKTVLISNMVNKNKTPEEAVERIKNILREGIGR
ncbi:YggU-like protein [Massarina eburnea CBS 473.64]|uniref:YggU-like protein n=1 Tax=Massarina eburnea CBS 473.64 TaxID=1395130 RepID=A0A6A6S125_9PLEO|nr:YggU-like protein [Massarina eburnea CBS 473.64]